MTTVSAIRKEDGFLSMKRGVTELFVANCYTA